jgi:hypothetical protein
MCTELDFQFSRRTRGGKCEIGVCEEIVEFSPCFELKGDKERELFLNKNWGKSRDF